MRKILFLAYHFPPFGGAGGQRNPQLVRYLREFEYEPIVLTGSGRPSYRWTPLDETISADGVEVHRISEPEPPRSDGWRGRRERWLRAGSPWERWWTRNVVPLACEVGRDADIVHASLAPYSTAEAALAVARSLGKPLVLDLEDPWALDEMMVHATRLHRRLELRRMRRILAAADAVVMNTPESARRVRTLAPEFADKVVVAIPNGFEHQDFAGAPTARSDGRFRIVHTGSFHTDLGREQRRFRLLRRLLGGTVAGVDFLTRSHAYLLEAVERLCVETPEVRGTIEVHLAGVLTDADREIAARSPSVRLHGFLSHPETIALVRSADALFLPMHDLPEGRRVAIVPCKTYEYAASGRPIVAAVPDGDARDLLARVGTASLCRPADTDAIATAIAAAVDGWRSGAAGPAPRAGVLLGYEWRHLTGELATLFDRLLAGSARREPRLALAK